MNNVDKEAFERWWHNEGSGMLRRNDEDVAEWVHRMAEIAWMNGADSARASGFISSSLPSGEDNWMYRLWMEGSGLNRRPAEEHEIEAFEKAQVKMIGYEAVK